MSNNNNNNKYSLDFNNLDSTPSCDIFGYMMSSMCVTTNRTAVEVVGKLFEIKKIIKPALVPYIDTILENIIDYGDIDDYMNHLTDNVNEFITSDGELVSVKDLSWL